MLVGRYMEETQQMHGSSSSSGSGEGKLKLQWEAYAKVDAEHSINGCACIPVMVSVTASSSAPSSLTLRETGKPQRAPVDVVVVLHVVVHGGAPTDWRELLKEAMDTIVAKLHDEDRLAVVPGASTLMTARRFRSPPLITSDTSLVRALECAESILLGRQQHDEAGKTRTRRAGYIIVISNSNDDMSSILVPYRIRSVHHTFGFRDAHNARAMQSLCSSIRNCTYAVLDDGQGHIAPAFSASIHRITSAAASMQMEVKIKCDQKVFLAAIGTPGVRHLISYDKKVAVVWPRAHLAAMPSNFVVYLGNLMLRNADNLPKLLSVEVKSRGGAGDDGVSPLETDNHKLTVQVVTSRNNPHGSKVVAAEMVRAKAVKIVADILAKCKADWDWEQLHGAADDLQRRRRKELEDTNDRELAAADHNELGLLSLCADISEMEIRLHNNYFWHEYMLSWHSHQRWQQPIPRPFMDKQPAASNHNPLQVLVVDPVVATAVPAVPGGQLLPVLVRVMAPEVGLAMVKRASVDLIIVLDASHGAKEMEEKAKNMLMLVTTTEELEEQRDNFIKRLPWEEYRLLIYGEEVGGGGFPRIVQPVKRLASAEVDERSIAQKRTDLKILAQKINAARDEANQMDREFQKVRDKTTKRLHLITEAIELVQKKLSVKDRLAIISTQSPGTAPAAEGLKEMSTQGQRQTTDRLRSLINHLDGKLDLAEAKKIPAAENKPELSTASHWRERTKKAIELMRTCLHYYTVNSSTPIPTLAECQGTTSMTVNSADASGSVPLSEALIHAVKILDKRQEQDKNRMGFIIVVSDRDNDSICGKILSHKYIAHAFGFHDTHNMWAMYHIASSSNGIYDILNDESNKLTEAFVACINNITSTIAVDTKIDLKCSQSSVLLSATESSFGRFGSSLIHNLGNSCSILAGALSAGTLTNFIIYMDRVHGDELFTVHVEWVHPFAKTKEKLEDQVVVRKGGADDIDRQKDEGIMAESLARVEAVKIVNEIAGPLHQDRLMVEANLKKMCQKCSSVAKDAREDRLARAMEKMTHNLKMETRNPSYFNQLVAETLSCMLSWLSYHHRPSQQAP